MNNDLDDEIIIGVNKPKAPNNKNKKKYKKKKKNVQNKKVATSATYNKKDKPKKSKKGLIFFLILLFIIIILIILMNIDICKIKHIDIVNNERVTKAQIEELANFDQYNNLFSINIIKVMEDISKNAYIEEVKINRIFPNTIRVTVKEKTPKYMLQIADSYIYINNQGYMLEVSVDKLDVPIILGFKTDLSDAKPGRRLEIDDLKQLEMIIKIVETAKANDIGFYITKIDVSDIKNYTLLLENEQKTVYLGDCSDLNTKMLYLSGILTQTKNLAGEIFLDMDLNTEDAYFREKT